MIDHWVGDWDVEQKSQPLRLVAGEAHDFRLELFQDTGGANAFLRWSGAGLAKQIVPESAFTPPDGFQVYPVDLSVASDGLELVADFEDVVTDMGQMGAHLVIEADTTAMPVAKAAFAEDDRSRIVLTLSQPIQRGQRVRFSYDGTGGLLVGGAVVPQVIRNVVNTSIHRLTTKWGDAVDREHPLPEYPRPQQVRKNWLNLNGQWEFAGAAAGEQPVFGKRLA